MASLAVLLQQPNNIDSTAAPSPARDADYSKLSFSDEFTSIDTIDLTATGDPAKRWFTDRPFGWGRTGADELSVKDGVLHLTPRTKSPNYSIGTASPTTKAGRGFHYGYFEARLAFNPRDAASSSGWPSFWGVSFAQITGANFPRSMEIDFFEAYHPPDAPSEDLYAGTIHDITIGPPEEDRASYGNNSVTMSGIDWSRFHTYGCLWEPGRVTWYFDGKPQFSQRYSQESTPSPNPSALPIGTFGKLDSDTAGQAVILGSGVGYPMQVDWVRVWQRT